MSFNIYNPLHGEANEIRLLTLLSQPEFEDDGPLDGNNHIRCELRTVSLDTNPKYEALSYVWGPPCDDDYSIMINGFRVSVRHNLLLALNALQARANSGNGCRTLWIDALCINQNDLRERENQVQIMGQIYASSHQVVAWLGQGEYGLKLDVEVGAALLKSEYWSRLWIIQEICLASSIQLLYGTESYGWWEFLKLIQNISNPDITTRENLGRVQRFHGTLRLYPSYDARERTLLGMLNISRDRLCKDPRDKLYGILSLAYDLKDCELSVSYSISLFDLFCSVISRIKFETGREGRTLLGRFGNLQDSNLFSWDVVEFCQSLQLSLLSPSFGDAVHQEMQTSRRNIFEEPATELTNKWANARIYLRGHCSGKILRVAQRYEELLNAPILEKPVMPENKAAAEWPAAMKTVLEFDHRSFVTFIPHDTGASETLENESHNSGSDRKYNETGVSLTRSKKKANESSDGLVFILTNKLEIGLAPNGTVKGDVLWTYKEKSGNPASNVRAIVRQNMGDRFIVHGRALLADDIPWLVDNVNHDDKSATSRDPRKLRWDDVEITVSANLAQIQALTCPLRSQHVA